MIDFGIIACGDGNRIKEGGLSLPKPLADIGGEPMIGRLVRIMKSAGAEKINIVLNQEMPEVAGYLDFLKEDLGMELGVAEIKTPSSLHSFWELVKLMKPEDKYIVSTVDTVFLPESFEKYVDIFEESTCSYDGMMGVTDFIDDEKPLYIDTDDHNRITGMGDTPFPGKHIISAGVYGLKANSIPVLKKCIEEGGNKLRVFQKKLVESGFNLHAFDMGKVIDVDHPYDIDRANDLINQYKSTIKINSKWLK